MAATTSHKHSFSVPSTPAYSSVSPTTTRSLKSDRFTAPPVTPQRLPRSTKHQLRSPATPLSSLSTPYTPLSLRSFSSSNGSAFTTPGSATSIKRLSFSSASVSPEVGVKIESNSRDRSLADIAENWRSRANENGIKVSSSCEEGHFADDEASDRTLSDANSSGFITTEEALLSPPFLSSTHRRTRALSQSQINLPRTSFPNSPQTLRTPARRVLSTLNTPPQKLTYAHQLKLQGSLTDPAHTRRRPCFGQTSTDLFDISENDHEYVPYPQSFIPASPARPIGLPLSLNNPFNDPVLPTINESVNHHFQHFNNQHYQYHFNQDEDHYNQDDEEEQGYYHAQHQHQVVPVPFSTQNYTQIFPSAPAFTQTFPAQPALSFPKSVPVPVPAPTSLPLLSSSSPMHTASTCSVCDRPPTATLAILAPCGHPLCSACLTSALNIVGEKDMECAVCKRGVVDFKLCGGTTAKAISPNPSDGQTAPKAGPSKPTTKKIEKDLTGQSFLDPLFSSPGSSADCGATVGASEEGEGLLPSAFDGDLDVSVGKGFQFFDFENARGASTPVPRSPLMDKKGRHGISGDNVVLRIDNVPWDITPPAIVAWLKQPVALVHVLLDRKGKTLSHAFVEMAGEEAARAALRGAQNSVLGKGRRARGVTVTRSGQEELMRAVFPSWTGEFDGARPSLAGLDHERVVSTLGCGLMSEGELQALLHLIRSPDSHFLKVPSLPFHSLISILSKFPADVDSRVFWSGALRDMLFDITLAAIDVLTSQEASDADLLSQVVRAGTRCQAFTSQQLNRLSEWLDSSSTSSTSFPPSNVPTPDYGSCDRNYHNDNDARMAAHALQVRTPSVDREDTSTSPFGALAREFGVETQLVQALVQRLSGMC